MTESPEAMALRMFPQWSDAMRTRWCSAKRAAARIPPHWASHVPMTATAIQESQFAARTLKGGL